MKQQGAGPGSGPQPTGESTAEGQVVPEGQGPEGQGPEGQGPEGPEGAEGEEVLPPEEGGQAP